MQASSDFINSKPQMLVIASNNADLLEAKGSASVFGMENEKLLNLTKSLGDVRTKINSTAEESGKLTAKSTGTNAVLVKNNGTLGSFISHLNTARIAIVGVAFAMAKMAETSINSVMGLDTMARKLGMSSQSLTAWQTTAKKVGADVNSVFTSINKTQNDLFNGRASNASVWGFLGIDIRKDPQEVMKQLVNKLKEAGDGERGAILQRLGLDSNNINLGDMELNMGRIGGLVRSEEEIKKIKELNKTFIDFGFSVKN